MQSLSDEPWRHALIVAEDTPDANVARGELATLFPQKNARGNPGFAPRPSDLFGFGPSH
ncbi:MAG TPA: hypothetical protein VF614_15195 [Chthoniobacteraceae bacterium]|jgi:hypothetical protein